jgi:hypothetical protein
MSLDSCKVFFSTADPSLTPKNLNSKIARVFQKYSCHFEGLSCSKVNGHDRDMQIEVHAEASALLDDVLIGVLKLLTDLPTVENAYAEMTYEELYDEEKTYHIQVDDKLVNFSSVEELNDYLNSSNLQSPEQLFYSEFGQHENLMLLRLTVKAKKFKSDLGRICTQYVEESSDASFLLLKLFIDSSPTSIDIDFPNMIVDFQNYTGICDIEIAKSLCFCRIKDDYIFIGFNSNSLRKSAEEVLMGENDAMNLVEIFSCCKAVKDSRAKIWSNPENPKKEWYIYDPSKSGMMCFQLEKSPVDLWATPYQ